MRQTAFFPLAYTCARVHLYYYYQAPSIRFSIIIRQLLYDPASASAAVGGLKGLRARSPGRRAGYFGMTRPALKRAKAVLLFRCAPMHPLFAVSAPLFAPYSLIYVKKGEKVRCFRKKNCRNIWRVGKIAVPLHPLSRNTLLGGTKERVL